jgi:sugar O-acyltransferase (sialic acid O-acetyltransferase NeuD family)
MAARARVIVIGAGGLAREAAWLIRDINAAEHRFDFVGYAISDRSKLGPRDSKEETVGDFEWLEGHRDRYDALVMGIGAPAVRLRLARELAERLPSADWPVLVHPRVELDRPSAKLARGAVLSAGVVGTVNIEIRDWALINLTVTLGHEAIVGRGCLLNPGINLSGGVEIGDGALVGTGACVLQYVKIGEGATVGAGAVVTKDVPPGVTVVGVPAKAIEKK